MLDTNPQAPQGNLPATQLEQHTQSLLPVSKMIYVSAITMAGLSRKHALNYELAVGISVYADHGGVTREAKRYLLGIYAEAGYDCLDPLKSSEYKTIMRRSSIAGKMYEFWGHDKVMEVVGGGTEATALDSIAKELKTLNIRSLDNLMATIGKPRLAGPRAPKELTAAEYLKQVEKEQQKPVEAPAVQVETKKQIEGAPEGIPQADATGPLEPGEIVLPSEAPTAHHDKELPDEQEGPRWMRRASDVAEGYIHVDTENIHISLPKEVGRSEVIAAAMKLLAFAEEMNGTPEPAVEEVEGALQAELKKLQHEEKVDEKPLQAELKPTPEPMKPRGRRVAR